MNRTGLLTLVVVVSVLACGSKSSSDDKPSPAPTPATADGGAATPRDVFAELKLAVQTKDFKRGLRVVRPHERPVFVAVSYLDVAMPVILKLGASQQLTESYQRINSTHNLVIDEAQLIRAAQSRQFSQLDAYFRRVLEGNDLAALWRDVDAALPKSRVIWHQIAVTDVTMDGDSAKVRLVMRGRDTAAQFDVIREHGRWYLDVSAFGKNQRGPRPNNPSVPGKPAGASK